MRKLTLLLLVLLALPTFGGDHYLPYGDSQYETKLVLIGPSGTILSSEDVATSNCLFNFRPVPFETKTTVAPNTETIINDLGSQQCNPARLFEPAPLKIGLLKTQYANVTAKVYLLHKASKTFFVVPALDVAFAADGDKAGARGIINDGKTNTYLALFNLSTTNASLLLDVYDAFNLPIGITDTLTISPGFNFIKLKPPVSIGRLVLTQGFGSSGFPGSSNATIVGFVSVGPDTNGSPDILLLKKEN